MKSMKSKMLLSALCIGITTACFAEDAGTIALPAVNLNRGSSTMQALQNRKSCRDFATIALPIQDLADLLWAANGFNRPDKRTNATGRNMQNIEIYVCMEGGAYFYDAKANELRQVTEEDLRPAVAGMQDFAAKAPVSVVIAARLDDAMYESEYGKMLSAYDAGIVSGNIYLFCSANGLATICRATMEREKLAAALQLSGKHVLHLNHPVGFAAGAAPAAAE